MSNLDPDGDPPKASREVGQGPAERGRAPSRDAEQLYGDELVRLAQSLHQLAVATLRREQDLQSANQYKSRLLALAEHDLRQPLQALRTCLRYLNARLTSVAAIRHVTGAQQALTRLEHCVSVFSNAAGRELAGLDRPLPQPPALDPGLDREEAAAWRRLGARRVATLTTREREIMDLVVAGHANKKIAARIGISQRTVEKHRAALMKKLGAASLAELIRMVIVIEKIARDASDAEPAGWARERPGQPRPHAQSS